MSDLGDRILAALRDHGAHVEVRDHDAASTAEEAAARRDTALADGCKAIVMKLGSGARARFAVLAFAADRSIDNRKLRRHLGVRRYRFATREELAELTGGLLPGSVPPFGRPFVDLPLYVDAARTTNPRMWFTNGSRTQSVQVEVRDWLSVASPDDVFAFTRDPSEPAPRNG